MKAHLRFWWPVYAYAIFGIAVLTPMYAVILGG
jgi:hypothetical protein